MKTLILYATKYGAAAEIAKRIAAHLDNADIVDIKLGDIPKLDEYDCVIIGSSVYAGSFRKEAKNFITQNADALCKKKLGLFVSAMGEDNEDEIFKNNVPDEVLNAATAKSALGGAFNPKKANFFERLIMKAVTKQSDAVNKINDEKISKFAEALKA